MREIAIYVPASSEYYSFNLDENTPLAVLADEVSSMLRQHDRSEEQEAAQDMIFYSTEQKMILDGAKTLSQLGIRTGSVLSII